MTNTAALLVALVFIVVFAAYLFGRRQGAREGSLRAQAEAPIRLREIALRNGRCPLCGCDAAAPTRDSKSGPDL